MRDFEFWLLVGVILLAPHLHTANGIGAGIAALFLAWKAGK